LFTCVVTPYRIAFFDTDEIEWIVVDSVVDFFFAIDIILNFFMAFYDNEYVLIDDRKLIALDYIKSWFFIDVTAVIPISLIVQTDNFNALARIARLPKLYRLIKMTR
jgi:hypothetical protein